MCSRASFWIFLSYWWRKLNAACAVRVLCELLPWRPRTASKCLSEEGVRGAKQICPVGGANDFSTVVFLHMIGERKKWDGERGEGKKKKKEEFQCWQQNISGSLTSCCSFNIGVCHLNLKKRKPFQNALSYLLSRKKSTSPPSPPPPKYNCDFSINFVWYCLSKEAIKYWLIPCSPTALSVSMKGSPEELLTGFEQSAMTAWRKKHCLAC